MFTARHLLSALLLLLSAGQLYAADGATDYLDGLDALGAGRIADADASLTKAIQADAENASYYQARGVARTLRLEDLSDLIVATPNGKAMCPSVSACVAGLGVCLSAV